MKNAVDLDIDDLDTLLTIKPHLAGIRREQLDDAELSVPAVAV